jgi:hypothetical protein
MAQSDQAGAYTIGRHVANATAGTAFATLHTVVRKRGIAAPLVVVANVATASGTFAVLVGAINIGTATSSAVTYASGASIAATSLPIYIPIGELASGDVVHIKGNANGVSFSLLGYERS